MIGHQLSTTRRLNRHYQSINKSSVIFKYNESIPIEVVPINNTKVASRLWLNIEKGNNIKLNRESTIKFSGMPNNTFIHSCYIEIGGLSIVGNYDPICDLFSYKNPYAWSGSDYWDKACTIIYELKGTPIVYKFNNQNSEKLDTNYTSKIQFDRSFYFPSISIHTGVIWIVNNDYTEINSNLLQDIKIEFIGG